MSGAPRQPQSPRRPSPAVYRRRRLVALVLLLVVIALVVGLVWWLVSLVRPAPDAGPGGSPATASSAPATPAASDDASPAASEDGSPGAGDGEPSEAGTALEVDCPPGDIVISASTDQPTYGADEEPVFELRVDNTGSDPCEANLGTTQQVFTVYSGDDRIFSTEDCQADPQDAMVEISPDQQERARFTWPRVRSAPECAEVTAEPRSGTYRLEVTLGGLEAQPVTFTL